MWQALTIVGGIASVGFLYWRVLHLSARLEETRQLTAGALDSHTTALERFSGRLSAVEYPRYMGTEIPAESHVECETPDPAWTDHDERVKAALEQAITPMHMRDPESSPFFTESAPTEPTNC